MSAAGTTIEGCSKKSWPEELRWSHTLGERRREIDEALEREREVERRLAPAGVVKGKLDFGFCERETEVQHREKLQLRFGFQIFGSAAAEDGESAREEDSGKDRVESRSWKARLLLPPPTSH